MTLVEAVTGAWQDLQRVVEADPDIPFDHEFTFQFHLAWMMARLLDFAHDLSVRFEVPCGKDPDGETIRLDLLLWKDPTAIPSPPIYWKTATISGQFRSCSDTGM